MKPFMKLCLIMALTGCGAAPAAPPDRDKAKSPQAAASKGGKRMVRVRVFDRDGKLVGPVETPKLVLSTREWKARLTPEQYEVLRSKGTERPFCGTLLDNKMEGVY